MINIMDILGVTYKEDIISNLLIHSLNNSVSFKTTSLENLVQLKNVSSYTVKGLLTATSFIINATQDAINNIIDLIFNKGIIVLRTR